MEFAAYNDANNVTQAFEGQIIDHATGYTYFSAGDKTGGTFQPNQNTPSLPWVRDYLCGFVVPFTGVRSCSFASYYCPIDGGSHIYDSLNLQPGFTQNQFTTNTQVPGPGDGANQITQLGPYISSTDNLNLTIHVAEGYPLKRDPLFTKLAGTLNPPLSFPTAARFGFTLPASDGFDYITIVDGTGGTINYMGIQTDYESGAQTVAVTFENPPGSSIDLNTIFNQASNTAIAQLTAFGGIYFYKDTQTFNGVTCAGYAILVSPDFQNYLIFNFVPRDATAAGWNTLVGTIESKMDRSGGVWLKPSNSDTTLFYAYPLVKPTQTVSQAALHPVDLVVNPGFYR
jgi:hypothetical protein